MTTPDQLFHALANPTRLRLVMLVVAEGELCVCELTHATGDSQPKVSRHLALLRDAGLLQDLRRGVWIYYRLSDQLPEWARGLLATTHQGIATQAPYQTDLQTLRTMPDRPGGACCA